MNFLLEFLSFKKTHFPQNKYGSKIARWEKQQKRKAYDKQWIGFKA